MLISRCTVQFYFLFVFNSSVHYILSVYRDTGLFGNMNDRLSILCECVCMLLKTCYKAAFFCMKDVVINMQ